MRKNLIQNLKYFIIGAITVSVINYYWIMPPRDWDYFIKDNDMLWAAEVENNYQKTNKVIWAELNRLDIAIENIELTNIIEKDIIAEEVLAIIIETINE